jgi:hypothetical protein
MRRPEPQAKELVAPRPFTSFRAAAGGRLHGAIYYVPLLTPVRLLH